MIYSGADLIRNSSHQQQRRAELLETRAQPVQSVQASSSSLDDQTQGALLRFARFIKDKKDERSRSSRRIPWSQSETSSSNPYKAQQQHWQVQCNKGSLLNIKI